MRRDYRRVLVCFALSMVVLLSVGGLVSAADPVYGGTLIVGVSDEVTHLDPHLTSQMAHALMIARNVFNGLVKNNAAMEVLPDLAERWEVSADGLTWTFYLREGVRFHNGDLFTAADVKFSLERMMDPDSGSLHVGLFDPAMQVEIIDDYTVALILSAPDSDVLDILAGPSIVMVPHAVVEANGDLNTIVVGTGPFYLAERRADVKTVLARNPEYFEEGLPYLDRIEFRIIQDDTARLVALRMGEVHFIDRVPWQMIETLENTQGVKAIGGAGINLRIMSPNINREPWDDPRVRQAFYMGINKQEIVDVVLAGFGEPLLGGVIPSTLPGHRGDPCYPDGDAEGAKALLAEAGYPDGFTTKLLTFGDIQMYVDYAQVVREQAKKFGVTVELELLELGIVQARRAEKDFDLVGAGIGGLSNGHSFISNAYASASKRNFNGYADPVIEDLLLQSKAAASQEERSAILIQMQDLLCESMPIFPLFTADTHWGVSDKLGGWEFNPGFVQYFGVVWLGD